MKILISQSMNGKTKEEFMSQRDKITEMIKKCFKNTEIEVINNLNKGSVTMLGESIKLMADADLVIFAPGWNTSAICVIERNIVKTYGIPWCNLRLGMDPKDSCDLHIHY